MSQSTFDIESGSMYSMSSSQYKRPNIALNKPYNSKITLKKLNSSAAPAIALDSDDFSIGADSLQSSTSNYSALSMNTSAKKYSVGPQSLMDPMVPSLSKKLTLTTPVNRTANNVNPSKARR